MKFQVELWAGKQVEVQVFANNEGEIHTVLDGVHLEGRIIEWAIQYGFRQCIRDAAAALKDDDKRNAAAWKRIDALKTNTLREGGGGGPKLTPVQREVKAIAEREIRAAFAKAENQAWVSAQMVKTKLTRSELLDAAIKAHVQKEATRLTAEAEANLAKAPAIELDLDIAS